MSTQRGIGHDARLAPATGWLRLTVVVALGLVAAREVVSSWRLAAAGDLGPKGDISVYIGAINYVRSGGALYSYPPDGGYGFTYPPFAAIVLRPLTMAPPRVAGLVWLTSCAAIAIGVAIGVVLSRGEGMRPLTRAGWILLAVAAFVGSAQVQSDLIAGQVNLILVALLLLDVGGRVPKRFRGVLVGLGAAVKLTPLLVIGWFAFTRQWRAFLTSFGTFFGCGLLALAILPADTQQYWTRAVFDTGRVGDVTLRFNASVLGVLARAGVDGPLRIGLWLLLGGVLVVTAYIQAERARRRSDPVAAMIVLGCAIVIATPITWPHHQIWLPLAGLVMLIRRPRATRLAGLAIVGFSVMLVPLTRVFDGLGMTWVTPDVNVLFFVAVCVFGLGQAHERGPSTREADRRLSRL